MVCNAVIYLAGIVVIIVVFTIAIIDTLISGDSHDETYRNNDNED